MTTIRAVRAYEALDSRGRPTVAARVELASGAHGSALAPSGASTGSGEAIELRDGGERYAGFGVTQAVANANGALAEAVHGLDAADQAAVDRALRAADGTADLGRLGGNAIVAISLATAIAASRALGVELYRLAGPAPMLPLPMVNIISGGAHAAGGIDVQDLLCVPVGASSFAEAIEWAARVRAATASVMAEDGLGSSLVADEGGLGPALASTETALELLARGIVRSGLRPGDDVAIAIDVAATQLVRPGGGYRLHNEGRELEGPELVELVAGWCARYPIVSVEDPLGDEDWAGWRLATERLGAAVQLLGDDLLVTDPRRLERAIAGGVANAVLVKPNQVGTVSEAAEVVRIAQAAGYRTVVSARSGDTEEGWLADLAVGWRAGQIKVGSTMRSERTAKWNRLLEIEALDPDAVYVGDLQSGWRPDAVLVASAAVDTGERERGSRQRGRASMREVADRAQVAMSSVSRVLSQHPDVSTAMRERVLAAVEELGYRPDMLAQGLRRGATQSVGFLVGDIAHPLLAAIVKGAEGRLRLDGYSVLIANSQRDVEFEGEQLRQFTQRRVDGMILSLASETAQPTLAALEDAEVPFVIVDREIDPAIPASYVLTDHRLGVRAAVGHLIDLGHRRIGLIAGIDVRPTRERVAGARKAFAERGLEDGLELVIGGDVTTEVGERGTRQLLDGPAPVTAILTGGNQILIGVLRTLQQRGLRFPDDVSLVTCDDTEITTVLDPPIGAVSRDDVAVGRIAAELLLRRLAPDDPGPETIVLETRFVARSSCAPPRL